MNFNRFEAFDYKKLCKIILFQLQPVNNFKLHFVSGIINTVS